MTPLIVMFIWVTLGTPPSPTATSTIPGFYSVAACLEAKARVTEFYTKRGATVTLECHTVG